jgi:hypothetical protein
LLVTGLSTLTGGFLTSASSTINNNFSVGGVLNASSTFLSRGLATFSAGFTSPASSSIGGSFTVSGALNASNTLLVNRLGTFYAGFIANASSSVGAPLTVSGPLNASSTLIVNQLGTFLGGFIANASSSIGANLQVAGIITVSSTATSSFAGSVSTTGNILVGGRLFSSSTEAGLDANCSAGQALNGVKVSGGIVVAGTCSTNAADIAEYYGSNGTLTNGQVVIATGDATSFLDSSGHHQSKAYVDITTGPTTTPIIGVISTNPNIPVLGDGIFTPEENPVPVALAGRVPVLVTNENGPIHVGDRLTISNTIPGYAAKATTSGWTIGTALQSSLSDTTTSTVIVFVNTS